MNPDVSIPELFVKVRGLAGRLKRRVPGHVEYDDLVSAGLLGVTRALAYGYVDDPAAFQSYALRCAAGAMLDELRGNDPLTRGQRHLARRLAGAERALSQELGREPEGHEVASAMGFSDNELAEARQSAARRDRVSLSAVESASSHASARPDALLVAAREAESLQNARTNLPSRLKTVLDLSTEADLTLREIGQRLGVTEGRVCQLRKEAVRQLRADCAAA
jgi:RNA polymerase sigma factor for flagellar operon FliA